MTFLNLWSVCLLGIKMYYMPPKWRVTFGNRIYKSNQDKRKSLGKNEQREKVDLKNKRPVFKSLHKHERSGSARDM